eukprot:CAMPEP_0170976156 /NCGR_PEP_ID=MMETSP0735-20130129/48533_1 /TAXON_ID=186038 /ORGANISM="Fragilariopsis kerguelensis, Strain L26-C5" /LENGTH=294 /DNA_ID=CAMNT_0011398017 /DNA_START=43 /DNA_END=925 /DNA_ORIENTATION=+
MTKRKTMNTTLFSLVVVVIVVFAATSVNVALADGDTADYSMTPIDSDKNNIDIIQGISEINISPSPPCSGATNAGDDSSFPNTEFVTVTYDYGTLYFKWNTDVSSTATSGGVRIGVPSDQLLNIRVQGGHKVQILDGFTKINTLDTMEGTNTTIQASMTTLNSTFLELNNNMGQMYVTTNIPVDYSVIQGGGKSWVETPSYNGINVRGIDSDLQIKGDGDVSSYGGGSVSDGAQLTITGTITGTINTTNDSIVKAPSCDNVNSTGGGTCNAGPQNVDVNVGDLSQNSQILNGTR